LLAAGCGGSGKSPTNGSTLSQNPLQAAFKYSACMRNHGVTNFPDPQVFNHNGEHGVRIQAVGPKSSPHRKRRVGATRVVKAIVSGGGDRPKCPRAMASDSAQPTLTAPRLKGSRRRGYRSSREGAV
jgi:hypothetical protein